MEENNQFRDRINLRNADLSDNWWPFVENINEILNRMTEIENIISDLDNKIGESFGLAKSITKSLYKIGFYDKEYKLNWKVKKLMEFVIEEAEKEVSENERRKEEESDSESESESDSKSGTV